jgi:hypothetical protein
MRKKVLLLIKEGFGKTLQEVAQSWGYNVANIKDVKHVCDSEAELIIGSEEDIDYKKIIPCSDCLMKFLFISDETSEIVPHADYIVVPLSIILIFEALQALLK